MTVMDLRSPRFLCLALSGLMLAAPATAQPLAHDMTVALTPATHAIRVTDTVTFAAGAPAPAEFLLNAALRIRSATPAVTEVPLGDTTPFFGNNGGSGALDASRVKRYRFTSAPSATASLSYEGTINTPLSAQEEEYARGFRDTPGLIGPEGVYLAGATFWYPHFSAGLVTFSLEARIPANWHVISQGTGTSRNEGGAATWTSPDPMDEIYLVGGPLELWRESTGTVEALVYLKDHDEALARKYLDATAQYLAMYRGLLGPYPYTKFALVENFWETGYGMPSFTLLGPSVIRFPFILTSSYPHEILHNWWGNGVFVDYGTGNWSEGLTAYLADHLIQEQRGAGATYRRNTVQKYRDYVTGGRDFALTEFRSRHSAATEAIGYGKMLMGAHMLRLKLGDERFTRFVQRFYREHRGKVASFADFRKAAEAVAGASLDGFFRDWIERAGAPTFTVHAAAVTRNGEGWQVTGELVQAQGGAPFAFDVPVVVQTQDGKATRAIVPTSGTRTPFAIGTSSPPAVLHVDPEFDVFRRLDHRETPPALSMIFGAPAVTAVLPADAPDDAARYRAMLDTWKSPNQVITIVTDREVSTLPTDRSVWLLGRTNRLAALALSHEKRFVATPTTWSFAGETMTLAGHSGVVVVRHPVDPSKAVGWVVGDPGAAVPGLGRKLPHYGRYSYLGFEGDEPVNTIKGEWVPDDSPMRVDVRPASERAATLPTLVLPTRKALVDLPPVFSSKALADHVAFLAAPEREGRGIGTAGLDAAAAYIIDRFKAMGLAPGGTDGYAQAFTIEKGPGGTPAQARNIVGVLAGTKPELAQQPLIVSAHYDHLGRGWPDARAGEAGQVHHGADDNASGVAVLLELARAVAAGEKPQRPIVFVAFSGEEAGLAGAKHFVAQPSPLSIDKAVAIINLDTVGRLRSGKVQILGAGTATEWPHIFRGGSFVTGVESTAIPGNAEASDQWAFIQRGIPGIQVFTGPHADYHRPTDTADQIDIPGMVKVATLVKEAVVYLAGRVEPMTVTITGAPAPTAATPAAPAPGRPQGTRRVTFGAVPDFEFQGKGVKLSGVSPGSPAEAAGMQAGDVLTQLDGRDVASLAEFSALLRTLTAGQSITATFVRDGAERQVTVSVIER
jgi:aminopeptidase N